MNAVPSYLDPTPGDIEEYAGSLELMAAMIRNGDLPLPAEGRAVSFQVSFHGPGSATRGADLAARLPGRWQMAGAEGSRFERRTGQIGCLEVSLCAYEPASRMAETAGVSA